MKLSRFHPLSRGKHLRYEYPVTAPRFGATVHLQSLGRIRRCKRCGDRTRSSVTYSIADPYAIVSLANNHSLEDPPYAATPHSARRTKSSRSAGTDVTAIRLSKIAVSLEPNA